MRISLVTVGPLTVALLSSCVAGVAPTDKSTIQTPAEHSGPEVILPPPLEPHTAEEGTGSQIYEYERRLGVVVEGRPPDTKTRSYSDGVITAITYREITDRISLVVDLYDDSDLNRLILENMIRTLLHAGHTVGGHPLFELSFSSHFHAPVYFKRDPDLGEISFGGSIIPHRLEMNVWSSSRDSLMTGRRGRSGRTGQFDFEIHASLRERSLGRVVWEGTAVAYVERAKAADAVPSMVDALVGNLGRSAHGKNFPLK
jgi:hypothetical protein